MGLFTKFITEADARLDKRRIEQKTLMILDGKAGKNKKLVDVFNKYQNKAMKGVHARTIAKENLEHMFNNNTPTKRSQSKLIGSNQWIQDMMDELVSAEMLEIAPGRAKTYAEFGTTTPTAKKSPKKSNKDIPYEREDGVNDRGEKYANNNKLKVY